MTVQPYGRDVDPEAVVARAMSRLGEARYDLFFNNCEHFARWCITGDQVSPQVVAATSVVASAGVPYLGAALAMKFVAFAGIVSGVSGAGIMSGLASAGGLVGGGAVMGLSVLGAGPGAFSLLLVNRHAFADDANSTAQERRARAAARAGGWFGAGAGAAGGVWALSHFGLPGLGAAGISSGLKVIGGLVGGQMAAGTMVVVALPALGVAVGAYLLYRLCQWFDHLHSSRQAGADGSATAV